MIPRPEARESPSVKAPHAPLESRSNRARLHRQLSGSTPPMATRRPRVVTSWPLNTGANPSRSTCEVNLELNLKALTYPALSLVTTHHGRTSQGTIVHTRNAVLRFVRTCPALANRLRKPREISTRGPALSSRPHSREAIPSNPIRWPLAIANNVQ